MSPVNAPRRAAKVAILDFEPGKHFATADVERGILGPEVEITLIRARTAEHVLSQIVDADVIIVWSRFELNAAVIARLERCRGIVCASIGYDHVDLGAAAARGIPVSNVPDYCTEEVADHTMALLLALIRNLLPLDRQIGDGRWDWKLGGTSRRLRGMRLGIVGFGRIGGAFARRAQVFGLEVGFYDPFVPSGTEKVLGVCRHESLDALLGSADIVSLHAKLTSQTSRIMDREAFSRLRRGALIINTARGGLVDTEALIDALASGQLGGAGLDVLAQEPEVPEALLRSSRVVLTPHSAWSSVESFAENRRKAATAALRIVTGTPADSVVNRAELGAQANTHRRTPTRPS